MSTYESYQSTIKKAEAKEHMSQAADEMSKAGSAAFDSASYAARDISNKAEAAIESGYEKAKDNAAWTADKAREFARDTKETVSEFGTAAYNKTADAAQSAKDSLTPASTASTAFYVPPPPSYMDIGLPASAQAAHDKDMAVMHMGHASDEAKQAALSAANAASLKAQDIGVAAKQTAAQAYEKTRDSAAIAAERLQKAGAALTGAFDEPKMQSSFGTDSTLPSYTALQASAKKDEALQHASAVGTELKIAAGAAYDAAANQASAAAQTAAQSARYAIDATKENAAFAAEKVQENAAFVAEKARENAAYVAEKTKENAAYVAEKTKENAVYVADKAKENAAYVAEKTKENAAFAADKAKETADSIVEGTKNTAQEAAHRVYVAGSALSGAYDDPNKPSVLDHPAAPPQDSLAAREASIAMEAASVAASAAGSAVVQGAYEAANALKAAGTEAIAAIEEVASTIADRTWKAGEALVGNEAKLEAGVALKPELISDIPPSSTA